MAGESVSSSAGWLRLARELDPIRATWRLFASVRWAISIIAFLALAGLVGVLIPQVPGTVRGDSVAEGQWLAEQKDNFGFLTEPMNRIGLFDIFHERWFIYALGLLAVSLAVWAIGYLPSIWRAMTRPRKRVNDSYFEGARHRFSYTTPEAGRELETVLRGRRYAVERYQEGDTTYLFADRYQFAQLGTFASHVSVIVILAGALVSQFGGFSRGVMIAEGASAPVFELTHAEQMQVQLLDAVGEFSEEGRPLEYRSELVIFQGGEEVKRCASTVNSPCSYDGYRFHQAAYFGFGADIQVRDLDTGNTVYRETLTLADTLPSPHVLIQDANGDVLLDEALVLTDILSTDDLTYYGRLVPLEDGRLLTLGARRGQESAGWELAVFEAGDEEGAVRLLLSQGESASAGGLEFTYADLLGIPAAFVSDFPLPDAASADRDGEVLLEMSNVVYGSDDASAGTAVAEGSEVGAPELSIVGLQPQAVTLRPGESQRIEGYEYTFLGQREFSGIQVRKDRSDYLIWIGTALLIGGVTITFWVPRRRLWAKMTADRTYMAGQAGHLADFSGEMKDMAREAGADTDESQGEQRDD